MSFVVDSSVALSWCFEDERTSATRTLLERVGEAGAVVPQHWPAEVLNGLIAWEVGQYCLFESAQHAPVSLTAPLEYTALVWAFLLGFLVWGDALRPGVFLGAALILVAGLILLLTQRHARKAGAPRMSGRSRG
jgi:drug/metabolite transporter (DMT)-like permease